MATLGSTYTGWNSYWFDAKKYACESTDGECTNDVKAHKNNYFKCKKCQKKEWFDSRIRYFQSVERYQAEAAARLNMKEVLPMSKQMKAAIKEFSKEGGKVKPLGYKEQPILTWDAAKKNIKTVTYLAT